jgi:hypothetical protein
MVAPGPAAVWENSDKGREPGAAKNASRLSGASLAIETMGSTRMTIEKKQQWICPNPECRHRVYVKHSGEKALAAIQCGCGATMKKVYARPQLRSIEGGDELTEYRELLSLARNP